MSAAVALARHAEARAAWLELERIAGWLADDELTGRIDCARLAILDVRDRLEQLHQLDELEAEVFGGEAAA